MNIFNGILNKENNVTEILKNLLYYKCFKDKFCEFLDIKNDFTNKDILTQFELSDEKSKKKFGIADLYIETEDSIYIIEIKTNVYTSLTEKQIQEKYLEYINSQSKNGEVIYLIPKYFYEKNKIKGKIKYWEDFLSKIKKEELDKINMFIKHFSDFLNDYWDINKIVKFNFNELNLLKGEKMNDLLKNLSVPSLLEKLFEIIEDIVKNIDLSSKPTDKYQNPYGYGYTIKSNNKDTFIWFGCDYKIWEEKGYPLILWIETNEKIGEKITEIGFEEYIFDKNDNDKIYIYNIDILKKEIDINFLKNKVEMKINEIKKIINKIKK